MMKANSLTGRVALVTGGASGIGRAACLAFAAQGSKVVVADINEAGGRETARRIGRGATFVRLDVADEAQWRDCLAITLSSYGKLNVLANVAGIGTSGDFEDLELATWNRVFAVNSTGPFLGCKHSVRAMKTNGEDCAIVNVASIAAISAAPDIIAYCASKSAVRMLTRGVALYCAGKGYKIRCNSINPTYVDSEMLDPVAARYGDRDAMLAAMSRLVPLGRLAKPEDIADSILFLASEAAAMITATELNIDGGQTAGIPPSHYDR